MAASDLVRESGRVGGRGVASVPASTLLANLLAYLLLLAGARALPHADYGELVAVLAILLVGTIPQLAIQTVTARRVALGNDVSRLPAVTLVTGLGAATVAAALAPELSAFLHMNSLVPPLLVAATLAPTTWFGYLLGVAQGAERFGLLAVVAIAQGIGRSGGGVLGLALAREPDAALVGVLAGTLAAALVATPPVTIMLIAAGRGAARAAAARAGSAVAEIARAAHGHGAFLLLASLDLLLARHVLGPDGAALYAAGTVISRAALWLPQSVGLLVFARLTAGERHAAVVRTAAAIIAAIGALLVIGTALAGNLVVAAIGGGYHQLARSGWLFALVGACLALVQFLMLAALALDRPKRLAVLWLVMTAEAGAVLAVSPGTASGVITVVAAVVAVGAVLGLVVAVHRPVSLRPAVPEARRGLRA